MLHRSVKYFIGSLSVLAATLTAAGGLFAWRLSQGPLDLQAVTPYVEEALSPSDSSYRVAINSTVVAWAGWNRLLDLRAQGILLVGRDGEVLGAIPEAAVSLSGRALLRGELVPRSIQLIGPRLHLVRSREGGVRLNLGGEAPLAVEGADLSLTGLADRGLRLAALERLEIVGGALEIQDEATGTTRILTHIQATLTRLPEGVVAEAEALAPDLGAPARVRLAATYEPPRKRAVARLTVDDIVPAEVGELLRAPEALSSVALPVSGVVEVAWQQGHGLERLTLELAAGAGIVTLPDPIGQSHAIAAGHLRAAWNPGARRLTLDELYLDLDGPRVVVTGLAEEEADGELFVRADATVREMPVRRLGDYWPEGLGRGARRWVLANIEGGVVREATLTVVGALPAGAPPEDFRLKSLHGRIRPEGATVHYLRPMPPVEDVSADIAYDASQMRIAIEQGRRGDLRLTGGEVRLTALHTKRPLADIALDIEGPLAAALKLLDREPLRYPSKLGLGIAGVGGQAQTNLSLQVPLLKGVRLSDVTVAARAWLSDVVLPPVVADLEVRDGNLDLAVNAKGMDVEGAVVLGGIPARLAWRENFGAGAPFRSRFHLRATLDEKQRRRLGLDMEPFVPPYLSGPVDVVAGITIPQRSLARLEADIDLAPAAMALPWLGWEKPVGGPAAAQAVLRFEGERLAEVERFVVHEPDGLELRGQANFDPDGKRSIVFERVRHGRTDVAGEVVLLSNGNAAVLVRGAALDAVPLRERTLGAPPDAAEANGAGGGDDDDVALRLSLAVDRLWLSRNGSLNDVEALFLRDDGAWRDGFLRGKMPAGGRVDLGLGPGAGGTVLRLESDDAGALLAVLDVADDVREGDLVLAVRGDAQGRAEGEVTVTDFRVVDAPLLARLLNLASITGALDVLRGEGLRFQTLSIPFRFSDGVVRFREARAWGAALGLTANGWLDLDRERLAVEGTIVPMYLVNSILGYVPFVGELLSPEKGGGLFAATYTVEGALKDPDIRVNPLSTLAPGVLRRLFGRDLDELDGR